MRRDFYIRQLRDWKGSADVDQMIPQGMQAYGRLCGWTLARAHARSGDRIAIAAYLGSTSDTFDKAIGSFAESYADQNERDYYDAPPAISDGRVVAESGVGRDPGTDLAGGGRATQSPTWGDAVLCRNSSLDEPERKDA